MDDTFIAMGEFQGTQHVQPSVPDGVTVTKLPVWYLLDFFIPDLLLWYRR